MCLNLFPPFRYIFLDPWHHQQQRRISLSHFHHLTLRNYDLRHLIEVDNFSRKCNCLAYFALGIMQLYRISADRYTNKKESTTADGFMRGLEEAVVERLDLMEVVVEVELLRQRDYSLAEHNIDYIAVAGLLPIP